MSANTYRVVGCPIAHSLSPVIHRVFAAHHGISLDYQTLELVGEPIPETLKACFERPEGIRGLSVTAPFKGAAFELADVRTPFAERARSANTLWLKDGKIHGDNTDGRGLVRDLTVHQALSLAGLMVLIVGAGGATQGIVGPLLDAGARVFVANRTPLSETHPLRSEPITVLDFDALTRLETSMALVIHATSVRGPAVFAAWPFGHVLKGAVAYDLAYSRDHSTPFLTWASAQGAARTVDGWGMLVEQAVLQFEDFHGISPAPEVVAEVLGKGGLER